MIDSLSFAFDYAVRQFSWVILFILMCYIGFEKGMLQIQNEMRVLQEQKETILKKKEAALYVQQRFTEEIDSQTDPAWIELVLMKKLGVVPINQMKVLFLDTE